ncbi:MAG: glycosyltransferase [Hyphomicrobiaceae bacterium]
MNIYQQHWPGVRAIEKRLHTKMTGILANSRRVLHDLLAEGCRPDQTAIIYNGVALPEATPGKGRAEIRQSLGITDDALVAIVVANLISYKGHADILTALGQAGDRLPKTWRLVCVGRDEGERSNLECMARDLGIASHVIFAGVRRDVADLLHASDLSILASHEEGFSNAVIEAMAAGLPLIVTDVGGNGEAVIDGQHGLVVPARNPERLGEAIVRLFGDGDLRQQMGSAAGERARTTFSMDACVDRYEATYRGLLAGKTMGEIDLD